MDTEAVPGPPGCNVEELRPDETTEDAVPVPPGCNVEELCPDETTDAVNCGTPDVGELIIDEIVFSPGCVDPDGEEDNPKEDADPLVWLALDAEETCPVENGSRVAVSVLSE